MKRLVILLPALLALQVGVQPALAWTWPVDGPVLRQFDLGNDPYAGGQHRGIDVAAAPGGAVLSPATGTVTFAGTVPSGGRTLTIETPDGLAVTLLHLGTIAVAKGIEVAEGAAVAAVGPSGELEHAEPYVHLGIRVAAEENGYRDPLLFLPPRPTGGAEPVREPSSAPAAETAAPPPAQRTAPAPSSLGVVRPRAGVRRVAIPRARMGRLVAPAARAAPVRRPLADFVEPPVHARSSEMRVGNEDSSRNWFSLVVVACCAAVLGVLRRQLRNARVAHSASAVFLQRFVAPAEDAERLRL